MRHAILVGLLLLSAACLRAQAPPRMSFQAVVRDNGGQLVSNGTVGMRISVLQGGENGTAVLVESHAPQTNANGLATLVIGDGTPVSGSMQAIDWATGAYYLKTETDPGGGTNYTVESTSQLLSVPYALHAANSGVGPQGPAGPQGAQGPPGEAGCEVVRAGNMMVLYTPTNAYGFSQAQSSGSYNAGNWSVTSLSGNVIGAVATEHTIVVYTTTHAYGFYQTQSSGSLNAGNWSVTSLSGNVIGAVSNQNQAAVYTDSNAYGFYQSAGSGGLNAGNWSVSALSGNVIGATASRHQIMVFTSSNAYGLYQTQSSGNWNAANWSVTALSGTPIDVLPAR